MRWLCCLVTLMTAFPCFAQAPVEYDISFENAAHHEAEVITTFSDLPPAPLQVRMSRTSPGRYALHEFAKNVYHLRAADGKGHALQVVRATPHQWDIPQHAGTVRLSYTIFGDRSDGTYLGIDRTHAHINIPAAFIWARGLEDRPVVVRFHKPDPDWRIATQLVPAGRPDTFTAPDLAYFIDSPVEISDYDLRTWKVDSHGRTAEIRLAIHHAGSAEETDAYARMAQAVVREEQAVFGELPAYDYGVYTFIADYLPYVHGDGMEHRNSTILSSTGSLEDNPVRLLGTLAHEFFHGWNVERMRPRTLEPFNLEAANMSGELWFAEGFTNYYDDLAMKRAGLISLDRYAGGLSRPLNAVLNAPGRRFAGPAGMSRMAPFVDAGVSIDRRNFSNTFVSYYSYGDVIALALDLTLRRRFPDLTLDDYMRAVWTRHGKTEIPYTLDDLRKILGEVTGDAPFADTFFERYIDHSDLPDYRPLLAQAGLLLRKAHEDKAWGGRASYVYDDEDGTLTITSATAIGSPLYRAGLDRGDVILSMDGKAPAGEEAPDELVEAHAPGDSVAIRYRSRGVVNETTLVFREDPALEVVPYEHAALPVTPEIEAFRARWLGSRQPGAGAAPARYCPVCRRRYPFAQEYCRYDGAALKITPAAQP